MKKVNKAFKGLSLGLAAVLLALGCGAALSADAQVNAQKKALEDITLASSYADVYKSLSVLRSGYRYAGRQTLGGSAPMAEAGKDTAAEAPAPAPTAAPQEPGADYSGTNVQVKGVDEGDIVKTDGKYIYILSDLELVIMEAKGRDTARLSKISVGTGWNTAADERGQVKSEESKYPFELFVSGDRLAVLSGYSNYSAYTDTTGRYIYNSVNTTTVDVYDISDRRAPRLMTSLGQDGYQLASRMVDGVVYLVSNYYVYGDISEDKPETFIPRLYAGGKASLMPAGCIGLLPAPDMRSEGFTVVAAYDLKTGETVSAQTLLGGGSTVYMSPDSIYVAGSLYDEGASEPYNVSVYTVVDYKNTVNTGITRLSAKEGKLTIDASGKVPGTLHNQFSMDEHEGYLRLVTNLNVNAYSVYTDSVFGFSNYKWSEGYTANNLYILDENLDITGKIEGMAKDEYVYSVRFDGKMGYICTFRLVDPLFAVDLSDPANPTVLSALKIPGFSEYLHVYGEGLLFGLGRNADEQTGRAGEMKLSMFDTSDPANVTEKHSLSLAAQYSEALYNHKAILVDPAKNLIAFPVENHYAVYGYDSQKGFYEKGIIRVNGWSSNLRGLYIGGEFYLVGADTLRVLDLTSLRQLATVTVNGR